MPPTLYTGSITALEQADFLTPVEKRNIFRLNGIALFED